MAEEEKSKFENEPERQHPLPDPLSGQWWIEETERDEKAFRRELEEHGPRTVTVFLSDGSEATCSCDKARGCDVDEYGVYDHECIMCCEGCICHGCEKIANWQKK